VKKSIESLKLVVNGGGAAGLSISLLMLKYGITDIIICDTKGAIFEGRTENMNAEKEKLAKITNRKKLKGPLEEIIKESDIFIGVSAGNVLKPEWIKTMAKQSCILALANPIPEIMPDLAKAAGAYIVCTGRSDFKN